MKNFIYLIASIIIFTGCSNIMDKEPLSETGTIEVQVDTTGKLYKGKTYIADVNPNKKFVIEYVKTGIHHYYMVYGKHLENKDIFVRAGETSKIFFDWVDNTGNIELISLYNGTLMINDRDFGDFNANEKTIFTDIPSGKIDVLVNFGNRQFQKDIIVETGKTFHLDLDENPVSEGLLARWEFNDNPKDITGNGNIGEEKEEMQYLRGKYGNALSVNENAWVEIDLEQINSNVTDQLTFSMWVRLDSLTGNEAVIFSTSNKEKNGHSLKTNKNYNGFIWTPSFISLEENEDEEETKNKKENKGLLFYTKIEKWTHLVLTLNSKEISAYVNGKFERKIPFSGGVEKLEEEKLSIGSNFGKKNSTFFGLIDNFRIYNKVLSADEIKKLYNE